MKKRTKIVLYIAVFVIVFVGSALVRIVLLGSAPERLIHVKWNDSVGTVYANQKYENANGHKYDLYIP